MGWWWFRFIYHYFFQHNIIPTSGDASAWFLYSRPNLDVSMSFLDQTKLAKLTVFWPNFVFFFEYLYVEIHITFNTAINLRNTYSYRSTFTDLNLKHDTHVHRLPFYHGGFSSIFFRIRSSIRKKQRETKLFVSILEPLLKPWLSEMLSECFSYPAVHHISTSPKIHYWSALTISRDMERG